MTFASPLFLLATLAAVLPIVLHLIHRKQARDVPFPTLRFLKLSVQRTRRRRFVEDALLMSLRIATLVLLALGLARPALMNLAGSWSGGGGRAVAIVLDHSGSMALVDGGRVRFETARSAIESILDRLDTGDTVALFTTGGAAAPNLRQLQRDQGSVRQALARATVSGHRADLAATLSQASSMLDTASASHRELYVVTDNQAVSWSGLRKGSGGGQPRSSALLRAGPPVVVVNVNHAPGVNAGVRDVRLQLPAPVTGVSAQVTAEIVNPSDVFQERHLELHVDGNRISVSPTMRLDPGASLRYEFTFPLSEPGVHAGFVRLVEDDASAADNRRDFVLTVDPSIRVGIVQSRHHDVPLAEDAFYLERALGNDSQEGAFRVSRLMVGELQTVPLDALSVIYLVNLPAPDPLVGDRLADYVKRGGHLVWIEGSQVEPEAYNAADARVSHGLLPTSLGTRSRPPAGSSGAFQVASLDAEHPALAPLTEPATLYRSVLVYQYLAVADVLPSGAQVLARLDNQAPWLVSRSVGAGQVVWLGTELGLDGTNLPLRPIFLPLVTRLTMQLAKVGQEQADHTVGSPLVVPLPPQHPRGLTIEITRPSGERIRSSLDDAAATTYRYPDTEEPGVYRASVSGAEPLRVLGFAVNGDPTELDGSTFTPAELERGLGGRRLVWCDSPADLPAVIRQLREGVPLRGPFLIAVLVALVAETFLANRRASKGSVLPRRPAPAPPGTVISPTPPEDEIGAILAEMAGRVSSAPGDGRDSGRLV
ncbi:MAG: BatA and WFA domain-containing protein [Isosphaeraceae bacterium]